jgi:hypothetical protein
MQCAAERFMQAEPHLWTDADIESFVTWCSTAVQSVYVSLVHRDERVYEITLNADTVMRTLKGSRYHLVPRGPKKTLMKLVDIYNGAHEGMKNAWNAAAVAAVAACECATSVTEPRQPR